MNNKKSISSIVIGMLLVSLTIITAPTAIADTPVDVWGYIYVDGVITTPSSASLIFQGYPPIYANLSYGGGAYKIGPFDAEDYGFSGSLSGTFDVVVSGQTYIAAETITITQPDSFYINLTVDTSSPPMFSNPSPTGTGVSISTSTLSVTIEDPDGDSFNWSITTSPNIGSNSSSGENNGTKTCSISGLAYSKTYTWTVSATDGTGWRNVSYSFTTEPKPGNGGNGGAAGGT